MPEEKARVGFSLDFKDSKAQIDALTQALAKLKKGFRASGQEGETSLNRINLGMKSVFQNISALSSNLRRSISSGQKMSRKQLRETLDQAKALEARILKIHEKTTQRFVQAEGQKKKAIKSTITAQEQAMNQLRRISRDTEASLERQRAGYGALASIMAVKVSSVLRDLIKESTLLAARNEVLGTAMRTVGNNAGISNAELDRTEKTVRKLGISINDTRELISRFAQAQLGMENATRLARSAQDLAAGSTLGSSEALRIMTQSILSLLPRQLRQFGVVVNLNQVYKEQSRILGKSVNDLTSLEKRQGLLNKIFEEAAKRAGAYERSMEDSGKVLTTLSSRIIPDTLSMLGEEFLPILNLLVFGFKDLLEWVQRQEGGFKTFVSILLAVGAAITSVVGAFTLFSGIVGAATGGFTGFATAASTTLVSLGPLALAIGAVTAGIILLSKASEKAESSQERLVMTSKDALNIQLARLKGLEDLENALKDQSLSEADIEAIIRKNIARHKELIPLLNKEKITREDVVSILSEHIDKQKALVDLRQQDAKAAVEADIERLKDEQFVLGELIQKTTALSKAKEAGTATIVDTIKSNREFVSSLTEEQRALENLDEFLRLAYFDDLKSLSLLLGRTDEKVKVLSLDLETRFGTAAKKTQQSSSDMQQALLGLEQSYDKLVKKALKKFPFKVLAKEQADAIKSIDKAVQGGLITQQEADDLRLKNQKVFQSKFKVAESKFQQKLDSIGKTSLQKIEARRKRELEVNSGSAVAIRAIERQAAVARNAVHEKMWQDRVNTTQEGANNIAMVLREERALAEAALRHKAEIDVARAHTTASQRIDIQSDLSSKLLNLLKSSQEEELSIQQQHFNDVTQRLQQLHSTGVINEEQFNKKSKALAQGLKDFQKNQITERVNFLKSALTEMQSEEANAVDNIKKIDEDKTDAKEATNDDLRSLQQTNMSDLENFDSERNRARKLFAQGEVALHKNNFDRVKQINSQIVSIAKATSSEVRETSKKDSEILVSADKARIGSIKLVQRAGSLLQRSFSKQRASEVEAMDTVKGKIDEVKKSLTSLLEEERQLEIKVVGEAEKQIDTIQSKLDGLEDKTVTITVQTKQVSVGGGETTTGGGGVVPGTPTAGGDSIPALAQGAVDIQGPGTSVSDSIIAMLSRGESVVNAAATRMFAPLLELMNIDPGSAMKLLAPSIQGQSSTPGNISESTEVGAVNIVINGVDSKDVNNINWRRAVREQIAPELKKLTSRKSVI